MDGLRVSSVATMLQGFPPLMWPGIVNGIVNTGGLTVDEGAAVLGKASALAKTSGPAVGTRAPSIRTAAINANKAAAKTLKAGAARLATLVMPPAAAAKNQGSGGAKKVLSAAKRSATGATRSASDRRPPQKRSKKKQQQFESQLKKARTGTKIRAWAVGYADGGDEIMRTALRLRVGSIDGKTSPMSYKGSQTVAPESTVKRAYIGLFRSPPSTAATFTKAQRVKMHAQIDEYQLPRLGNPSMDRYLSHDDDEFIAQLCETCCEQGFPFNRKSLASLVVKIATAHGRKNVVCGKSWMRAFLSRHSERLGVYKPCAVGSDRANQASEAVRDAVFAKLNALLDLLVTRELLTQAQRDDSAFLAPLFSNMDEIGLDFTKRWESIIGSKQARKKARKLRKSVVMPTDPTHVPFHVSVAVTSIADGTFCPVQMVIHSGVVSVLRVSLLARSLLPQPTWTSLAYGGCGRGARRGVGVVRGAGVGARVAWR